MAIFCENMQNLPVVLEYSNTSLKLGYAGSIYPLFLSSSHYLSSSSQNKSKGVIKTLPHSLQKPVSNYVVKKIVENSYISNIDDFESIISSLFSERMAIEDLTKHPILIVQPPLSKTDQQKEIATMLFEKFNIPALHFVESHISAVYSQGKTTALALDMSETAARISPVIEARVKPQHVIQSPLSGMAIKSEIKKVFQANNIDYTPYISGQASDSIDKSFDMFNINIEFEEFMKSMLEISPYPLSSGKLGHTIAMQYEFQSGATFSFSNERFSIPEIFFNPSQTGIQQNQQSAHLASIPQLIASSLTMCDPSIRPLLASNFVLTGGLSLIRGFSNRLSSEFYQQTGHNLLKIKQSQNLGNTGYNVSACLPEYEAKSAGWIGGSMLGSMPQFLDICKNKSDFEEI
ncbi:MAG: Actin-like 6A, partial [Paramarteilia canceri]